MIAVERIGPATNLYWDQVPQRGCTRNGAPASLGLERSEEARQRGRGRASSGPAGCHRAALAPLSWSSRLLTSLSEAPLRRLRAVLAVAPQLPIGSLVRSVDDPVLPEESPAASLGSCPSPGWSSMGLHGAIPCSPGSSAASRRSTPAPGPDLPSTPTSDPLLLADPAVPPSEAPVPPIGAAGLLRLKLVRTMRPPLLRAEDLALLESRTRPRT
jgi:hypothetical protein